MFTLITLVLVGATLISTAIGYVRFPTITGKVLTLIARTVGVKAK